MYIVYQTNLAGVAEIVAVDAESKEEAREKQRRRGNVVEKVLHVSEYLLKQNQ